MSYLFKICYELSTIGRTKLDNYRANDLREEYYTANDTSWPPRDQTDAQIPLQSSKIHLSIGQGSKPE